MNLVVRKIVWARTALKRVLWGAREFGALRTARGFAHLFWLGLRRPGRAEVTTTSSGFRIAFAYPAQLMPLLVVFEELPDPELGILPLVLGPGRVAVDVGASIGTWTLCAADTGAMVHAFEPDSENLSTLNENVLANRLASNVITHDLALGASEGWTTVSEAGRRYLTNVRLATNPLETSEKRMYRLDELVLRLGVTRIDVLKVNTAGCEADVLTGCQDLFRRQMVGIAMFLDGLAVRPLLAGLRGLSYELGFYDGKTRAFIIVDDNLLLDDLRPGPMNRYILVKHSSVVI